MKGVPKIVIQVELRSSHDVYYTSPGINHRKTRNGGTVLPPATESSTSTARLRNRARSVRAIPAGTGSDLPRQSDSDARNAGRHDWADDPPRARRLERTGAVAGRSRRRAGELRQR